jgi:hypothetical protein
MLWCKDTDWKIVSNGLAHYGDPMPKMKPPNA